MPKISDVLERESRSVDLEQGDFERLLDRRERRERNRRIRAGALGVIMVLAVGTFLVRSLTSDHIPANPPVEPSPAPLSGAIAYDLRGHIYVAGMDGSNPVAIEDVVTIDDECSGKVYTIYPSWSPNGRYLAFNRGCGPGPMEVVITDLQGNVVESFRVSQAYPQEAIAWSPDSTHVAVWDEYRFRPDTYTIGVHGLDGTHDAYAMPPGYAPSPTNGGPIWAADSASLIVSGLEVPLDGGTPREVPYLRGYLDRAGGGWTGGVAYSPDGSQLAYGTPDGLTVARADGSDPRVVSDDGAHTVAWSPNGELIAVASNGDGLGNIAGGEQNYTGEWLTDQAPNRLRVVGVATGSATLLAEGAWFRVIGFSPEGDRIIYGEYREVALQPETYVDSIWSVRVDGSDPRQIAVGTKSGALRSAGPGGGDQP